MIHISFLFVLNDIFQRLDGDRSGLTKMKKSVKALYNAGKSKSAVKKPSVNDFYNSPTLMHALNTSQMSNNAIIASSCSREC